MGLDALELLLTVEESFGISFPDIEGAEEPKNDRMVGNQYPRNL
jgi:hypothetical protein